VTALDTAALARKGYRRYAAGSAADVVVGRAKIVEIAGLEIGLFRVDDGIYAIRNHCPHQGGPVCRGRVVGTMVPSAPGEFVYDFENRVLACPWHHWQYDITSGKSLFGVDKSRLITYEVETFDVEQEGGEVYVWVRRRRERTTRGG
jgi:nitrite reductase/ring-hydroxylating ferredoxin subunit